MRIVFLTGTRADFGKLKPLLCALDGEPDHEVVIFVTGMHLLHRYGYTCFEIEKCEFQRCRIVRWPNQDDWDPARPDQVLHRTIEGLGQYVDRERPDMIVVHGDRAEALAGAAVGALNGIRVAHIEGGELSGTVDEIVRHGVTKLSHIHLVANEESKRRVEQLGERNVFVTGSPEVDVMLDPALPALDDVRAYYRIEFARYSILLYHSDTHSLEGLDRRARALVDAVLASGRNFVVIYPNNDPGSQVILAEYERFADNDRFTVRPSLRFEYFLTLLKHSDCIVGNSSAGVREAPVFGIPSLSVGQRQRRRFSGSTLLRVDEDEAAIRTALDALPTPDGGIRHFGDGRSTARFIELLNSGVFTRVDLAKDFRDL